VRRGSAAEDYYDENSSDSYYASDEYGSGSDLSYNEEDPD